MAPGGGGRQGIEEMKWRVVDGCRRDCVGQTLAKLTVVSHMCKLLGHFHFRLAEERVGSHDQVERDQTVAVTVSPGKGMWMYAEPRCL